ncbi:MAG: hypothetical protein FJ118_10705 [Deltaproteobacteria bacterium]|nr:hypothetical protein [Deltaproteobacteria bacterium]
MKRFIWLFVVLLVVCPSAHSADWAVFLNAFGETATAYLNDAFLLIGATADAFVAGIIDEQTAVDHVTNVQKRVQIIRAKIKAVSDARIAEVDRQLLAILDGGYACLDHEAWALVQYVKEKSPASAKRFDEQRTACFERLRTVADFYAKLPTSPQLPEPLSTR